VVCFGNSSIYWGFAADEGHLRNIKETGYLFFCLHHQMSEEKHTFKNYFSLRLM
jgi:hypothetical protein